MIYLDRNGTRNKVKVGLNSKAKTTNANGALSAFDLDEQIRRHAYELYVRRGCEHGRDAED